MIGSQNSTEYGAPRFQGVLGHLAMTPKRQARARVIGFVGCRKSDGTTFVMNELARNLARGERRREVVTCVGGLMTAEIHLQQRELRECCVATADEGVWRLDLPSPALTADSCDAGTPPPILAALLEEFDSVLLDLGAAATSGSVWRLAHHVDDLLLVVAAGETRRSQIASAQRILEQAGGRVSGCILNKRTYPLPRMLYRMLNE